MLAGRDRPRELTTDLAAPLLHVVDELLPGVLHDTTHDADHRIEWYHDLSKPGADRCAASGRTEQRRP